jgi:nitrogen fixation protein FixH
MESMPHTSHVRERRSARFWGAFILGLMTINLVTAGFAIYVAVGDPSFRPMPNYGENAVDWQTQKELQARSDALGWVATVERSTEPNGVRVQLVDASGNRVTGAQGSVLIYHFTRAYTAKRVPLREIGSGEYLGELDAAKDGRWQLTIDLSRSEEEHFYLDKPFDWYHP